MWGQNIKHVKDSKHTWNLLFFIPYDDDFYKIHFFLPLWFPKNLQKKKKIGGKGGSEDKIKWGVLFQNAISPKIWNQENYKNVVNSVLLYLRRSVMDQIRSGTVEWRFAIPSHVSTKPTPGKGVMWKDIVFWSENCVLMQCGHFFRLQIKMQHRMLKINNISENVINLANLLSLWSTPLSSRGVDHKDGRLARLITFSSLLLILNMLCCILIHIWSR